MTESSVVNFCETYRLFLSLSVRTEREREREREREKERERGWNSLRFESNNSTFYISL